MPDQFTPLTAGMLPSASPTIGSGARAAAPASMVTPFSALPLAAGNPSAPDACARPEVTLLRNATGVVTGIRVLCGCGRVTELNCVY